MSTAAAAAEAGWSPEPDEPPQYNPGAGADHGPLFDPSEPFTFAPHPWEAAMWRRHYLAGSASAEATLDLVEAVRFRRSLATSLAAERVSAPVFRSDNLWAAAPDAVGPIQSTGVLVAESVPANGPPAAGFVPAAVNVRPPPM